MPRFYFHVHDGREIRDDVGTELPGLDEARQQAIIASGEILRDHGQEFWTGHHWQMYVVDEAGKTVVRLNFSAESRPSETSANGSKPIHDIEVDDAL